jgi:hypothetical protein
LAQGSESIEVGVKMRVEVQDANWTTHYPPTFANVVATWDQIFAAVGPELLDEASQAAMRRKLNAWFALEAYDEAKQQSQQWIKDNKVRPQTHEIKSGAIFDEDFDTMLLQLRALGLVRQSERKRSVKDTGAYWTLTPYGDEQLTTLRAIRRTTPGAGEDGGKDTKE